MGLLTIERRPTFHRSKGREERRETVSSRQREVTDGAQRLVASTRQKVQQHPQSPQQGNMGEGARMKENAQEAKERGVLFEV